MAKLFIVSLVGSMIIVWIVVPNTWFGCLMAMAYSVFVIFSVLVFLLEVR